MLSGDTQVILVTMRCTTVVLALAALFALQPAHGLIPQPVSITYSADHFRLPLDIEVAHNAPYCFVLHAAIKRLLANFRMKHPVADGPIVFNGTITKIDVELANPCDELTNKVYPTETSNESCRFVNLMLSKLDKTMFQLLEVLYWSKLLKSGVHCMGSLQ